MQSRGFYLIFEKGIGFTTPFPSQGVFGKMWVMTFSIVLFFLLSGLLGYIIGRWGDNYVNFWFAGKRWFEYLPDHWIYGLALMVLSLFFFGAYWVYVLSFGAGHFISDLKDFWHLKFYGPDGKERSKLKFWHID